MQTRTLTGKIAYVRERHCSNDDDRRNPTHLATLIAQVFYSHLAAFEGMYQPHMAVKLPSVREVGAAMRRMDRPRAPKISGSPATPYWNR